MNRFAVIRKGDKGERVKALQTVLNRVMDYHLVCDGDFGEKTEKAVIAFQTEHVDENGVFLLADGIVGEKTVWALGNIVGSDFIKTLYPTVDIPSFASGLVLKKATKRVRGIVLHCTAEKENECDKTDAKKIDRIHKSRGWSGIGYNYLIKRDGTIENGRDVNVRAAHTDAKNTLVKDRYDLNTYALGIVYVGGLDKNGKAKDTRTDAQKKSEKWLVRMLMDMYGLTLNEVYCHNQFANKACPCYKIEDFRKEMREEVGGATGAGPTAKPLGTVVIWLLMVGFLLGSCGRKVIDTHVENEREIQTFEVSNEVVKDSSSWEISINSLNEMVNGTEEWWKARILRTHFAVDSLGNKTVTLEESIDVEGGRKEKVEKREEEKKLEKGKEGRERVEGAEKIVNEKERAKEDKKVKTQWGLNWGQMIWMGFGLGLVVVLGWQVVKRRG